MDRSGLFADRDSSVEELHRIIGGLNSSFGLSLEWPDQTLSSFSSLSSSSLRDSSTEKYLNYAIWENLGLLLHQRRSRLAECLGRFQVEARQLSCPFGYTPRDRVALLSCLLRILSNDQETNTHKGKQPQSVDSPSPSHQPFANSRLINDLPVFSRAPTAANYPEYIGSLRIPRDEPNIIADNQNLSFTNRNSFAAQASRPFEKPTGRLDVDGCSRKSEGSSSWMNGSTSASAFGGEDESCTSTQESFLYSPAPESHERLWRHASIGQETSDTGGRDRDGNGRLEDIWPRSLAMGLQKAPLPVIWEVTRAALHCHVNLDELDLKYEPSEKWHDQAKLRSTISKHRLFLGKHLPASSDSMAWDASLKTFHSRTAAVLLCAELSYNENANGPLYNVRLHPLKMEMTHRLARRFGADRFLEVVMPSPSQAKIPTSAKEFGPSHVVRWLTQENHNFLGRTWVPFYFRNLKRKKTQSKKKDIAGPGLYLIKVYFFASDGHGFQPPRSFDPIPPLESAFKPLNRTSMKLRSLLEWAVNISSEQSSSQPVTKLFSRLSLSLSQTRATVVLDRSQILVRDSDLGTHSVMNDGIGQISRTLAVKIAASLGLSDCPSAFQARIGSAKGMWIIDVNNENPGNDWIEIFPSQEKWNCDFEDPHHRTFEVRNWSKELQSACLNHQFIPVLEAQSIDPRAMRRAIKGHLTSALQTDLELQKRAMTRPMDLRLWLQSMAPSDRSLGGCAEFLGGLPEGNVEKVAFLLDSGFDQRRMRYMNDLVFDMCKRKAEMLESKMNILIPCSSYVYMAADFSNTLEEGEVHLSFSTKFQVEGFSDTMLEDIDVLVARAPAHFPSDIQKVRVVSRPELRKLKDIIIFSTKGKTALADKLSGGDYDGDMAWVCWDREIVGNFRNAPVPETPNLFEAGYLRKHGLKFNELLQRTRLDHRSAANPLDRACEDFVAEALSFNLQPALLGICTKYKEKLCYIEDSVTSDAAITLSTLLGNLVDQAKQGILFSTDDWKRFCKEYIAKPLALDEPAYVTGERSRPTGKRTRTHVLDYLRFDVAKVVIQQTLTTFSNEISRDSVQAFDPDLTYLYRVYEEHPQALASGCTAILRRLKQEIEMIANDWSHYISRLGGNDGADDFSSTIRQLHQRWFEIQPAQELLSTPFSKEILQDWGNEPNTCAWQLLKASATFSHLHRAKYKFVWHMAGMQLGFIKARMHLHARETAPVLVIPEMWSVLKPDKKLIEKLAAQRAVARATEESSPLEFEEVWEFDDNGTVVDDAW